MFFPISDLTSTLEIVLSPETAVLLLFLEVQE
jgi:hypothetical protein